MIYLFICLITRNHQLLEIKIYQGLNGHQKSEIENIIIKFFLHYVFLQKDRSIMTPVYVSVLQIFLIVYWVKLVVQASLSS